MEGVPVGTLRTKPIRKGRCRSPERLHLEDRNSTEKGPFRNLQEALISKKKIKKMTAGLERSGDQSGNPSSETISPADKQPVARSRINAGGVISNSFTGVRVASCEP